MPPAARAAATATAPIPNTHRSRLVLVALLNADETSAPPLLQITDMELSLQVWVAGSRGLGCFVARRTSGPVRTGRHRTSGRCPGCCQAAGSTARPAPAPWPG